jgi:hypothetical protein
MGINGARGGRVQSNIKFVENTYMPDNYDAVAYAGSYHGLAIPSVDDFLAKYGYDATPVDRAALLNSKDPKLRNDPTQLIFHRVKFTQEQWDFMLEQASDDMTLCLKEIYADMVLREGEFKFKVGKVKYLGPGKPGHCGEPSCNHSIGTAYYLEPVDPSRKDLGDYPEYVGSTCITHIAGIDPKTAMEIKKLEQDAKGERDSVAEALENYGSFDKYIAKTEMDKKIVFLKSVTEAELEEYNRRLGLVPGSSRALTLKRISNRIGLAESFLEHRLPLREKNSMAVNSFYSMLKWQRSENYRRETNKEAYERQEQQASKLRAEQQERDLLKKQKEEAYTKFCESYLAANPNNSFIKSLRAQLKLGRGLSIKQEEALDRTIKQQQGLFSGTVNKAEADQQKAKLEDVIKKVEAVASKKGDKGLQSYVNYLESALLPKLEKGIPLSEASEMEHYHKALRWLRSPRA